LPTAARLIAALMFAALAWWGADLIRATLPESLPGRYLAPVSAALGLLFGWRMLGARAGDGYIASTGYGLTTLGLVVFWALLIFSASEMVHRSLRKFYDGPMEGLEDMIALFLEYGRLLIRPESVLPILVGALFCAAVVEFVAQRRDA
jgi:hypothetical protein